MAERFINLWRHARLGEVGEVFTDAHEAASDAMTPVRSHTYLMTVIVRDGDTTARVINLGRDAAPYPGSPEADRQHETTNT